MPEEFIGKLREAEIVLAQGGTTADACHRLSISEQTYYRWCQEYGGLKTDLACSAQTTVPHATAACAMSCLTAKSSTALPKPTS